MKQAKIDNVIVLDYSHCFVCKQILISKLTFLDVSQVQTEKIEWALILVMQSAHWKWMRTRSCTCQRICVGCAERRKNTIKLVLTRGYGTSTRVCGPTTLPELIEHLNLGSLESLARE